MTIDFEIKKDVMLRDRRKREIICKCALNALISATQEINSTLYVLEDNDITGADILDYVENCTDTLTPYLFKDLTKLHGGNLVKLSEVLEKRLLKRPALTDSELEKLNEMKRETGLNYFIEQNAIIFQEMNKHAKELLEIDSI